MKQIAALILIFAVGQAWADQKKSIGTVTQKITNNKRVLVQVNETGRNTFGEGDSLLLSGDEEACEAPVESVDDGVARVDASGCNWSDIKKGQAVYLAAKAKVAKAEKPVEPAPAETKPARHGSGWFFLPGAGLGFGSTVSFDNTQVTDNSGNSGTVSVTATTNPYIDLSAEVGYMPEESWGFLGGVIYNTERTFTSLSATSGGVTYTLNGGSDIKYSSLVIDANALYRWHYFYLPFGLNYTSPSLSGAGITLSGRLGGQLGFGFQITDSFGLEIWLRGEGVKASTVQVSGGTIDYGTGSIGSLLLIARYYLPF